MTDDAISPFVEPFDDDDPASVLRQARLDTPASPADVRARGRRKGAARRRRAAADRPVYDDVEEFDVAARRLKMAPATLAALGEDGAVTVVYRSVGSRRRYLADVGIEREEIWTRFVANNVRPSTLEGFAKVVRVGEALRIPGAFEWCDEFCDGALDLIEELGLPQTELEFHGLVRAEGKTLTRLYKGALARRGVSIRRFNASPGASAGVASFRRALIGIDRLPGTLLAESDEVLGQLVAPRLRAAVSSISDPAIRAMAGFYVSTKAGSVTPGWARQIVRHLAIAAEVLSGVPKDPVSIDREMRRYVFGRQLGWADGDAERHAVGASWLTASNLWKAHAETYGECRDALRRAMPPFPHLVTHFARDLRQNKRRLRREAHARRKGRTNVVADMRELTEVVLEARMAQVDRWTEEFLTAKRRVASNANRSSFRFHFTEEVVPIDGPPDGAHQVVTCEAIRVTALRERLLKTATGKDRLRLRAYMPGGSEHNPTDEDEIVCVFHSVREAEGSCGSAVVPVFVRLHLHGCLMNPTRLTAEKQAERAALHRLWQLPTWSYSPAELLVPFVGAADEAAGRALRQGVVVLHLEPYRHAMRFGHLAGRIGLRTGARSGEMLQLRWQKSGFGFARVDGRMRVGFRAVPKGWKDRQRLFLLDDRTFASVNDLVLLTTGRFYPAERAAMLPRREVHRLRITGNMVVHAVFQSRNGLLDPSDLNQFFRLLMAGLPMCLLHDLRHVYATIAHSDGIPLPDVSDLLSQEGGSLAAYYAAATDRLRAMREVRVQDRADVRFALSGAPPRFETALPKPIPVDANVPLRPAADAEERPGPSR